MTDTNPTDTPVQGEKRELRMGGNLLRNVITRQAGTLSKAVLEAVMNAIDAGANSIHITVAPDGRSMVLKDDGRGFQSRDEILTRFEVFGFDEPASHKPVFGEFHMGRGQMFAMGKNTWRTGKWTMLVNIQEGLGYELRSEREAVQGCTITIEFFQTLTPTDVYSLGRDLALQCKHAPLNVIYNGKPIGTPPSQQKWDRETDDAYFRLKATGDLRVYNQGIYVHSLPTHKLGCGGEIVSKRALKVNFARNDVQHDCPEWASIARTIRDMVGAKPRNAPMTDGQRQHLAEQIITGTRTGFDALKAKVITAVNGRHYTVESMARWTKISVAAAGDRPATRAMDNKVAFMLAKETLERFDVETVPELLAVLRKATQGFGYSWPKSTPYEDVVRAFEGVNETLDHADLNANLRAWIALAEHAYYPIWSATSGDDGLGQFRKLHVGQSSTSDAWTDGSSYITINNDFLEALPWNSQGFTRLGILLVQMFSHKEDSTAGLPDQTYFEQVHQLMEESLPQFVQMCVEGTPRILEVQGRRITKQIAEWQSEHVRVDQAKDAFTKQLKDLDDTSKGKKQE